MFFIREGGGGGSFIIRGKGVHLNIATCKWWCPFILVEEAMFQMGEMYLVRSHVEAGDQPGRFEQLFFFPETGLAPHMVPLNSTSKIGTNAKPQGEGNITRKAANTFH